MPEFTIYMEIGSENGGAIGAKLRIEGVAISPGVSYGALVKNVDPYAAADAAGFLGHTGTRSCHIISPEEYAEKYGNAVVTLQNAL